MEPRVTRSRSRQPDSLSNEVDARHDTRPDAAEQRVNSPVEQLPLQFKRPRIGISKNDYEIMMLKQRKLKDPGFQQSLQTGPCPQAAAATLVFAQYEAGTAVCISSMGSLLTCAHCVYDAEEQGSGIGVQRWLLFASGQIVQARCTAWDSKRDLALLQVVAAQSTSGSVTDFPTSNDPTPFPSLPISSRPPRYNDPLLCIGHPGSEDLEASTSGIETDYDVLHISSGRFRGLAKGQDPQDNGEIGALKHNCWTYWGHSGAPLVMGEGSTWRVVGLHSSWDDETGVRRGVPLEAVRAFLEEHVEWSF